MKHKLSEAEKEAVKLLKNIPEGGMFNQIIRATARENKVDNVRQIFKIIRDQVSSCGIERMDAVIGAKAVNAVLSLPK